MRMWHVPLVPVDTYPGQVLGSGPRDTGGGRVRNSSGWEEQPGLCPVPKAMGCGVGPALAGHNAGQQVSHPSDPGV